MGLFVYKAGVFFSPLQRPHLGWWLRGESALHHWRRADVSTGSRKVSRYTPVMVLLLHLFSYIANSFVSHKLRQIAASIFLFFLPPFCRPFAAILVPPFRFGTPAEYPCPCAISLRRRVRLCYVGTQPFLVRTVSHHYLTDYSRWRHPAARFGRFANDFPVSAAGLCCNASLRTARHGSKRLEVSVVHFWPPR